MRGYTTSTREQAEAVASEAFNEYRRAATSAGHTVDENGHVVSKNLATGLDDVRVVVTAWAVPEELSDGSWFVPEITEDFAKLGVRPLPVSVEEIPEERREQREGAQPSGVDKPAQDLTRS